MPRPATSMQRYARTAPNLSMRTIAKAAVENGLTIQGLAQALGCNDSAVRRVFDNDKTRPQTIRKYATALEINGTPLFSEAACRKLEGSYSKADLELDVLSFVELAEYIPNASKVEVKKNIDRMDEMTLKSIAGEFENIAKMKTDVVVAERDFRERSERLFKNAKIKPGMALVHALMAYGYSASEAVNVAADFLEYLKESGSLKGARGHISAFHGDKGLHVFDPENFIKPQKKILTMLTDALAKCERLMPKKAVR